jgi:hypothetical protein
MLRTHRKPLPTGCGSVRVINFGTRTPGRFDGLSMIDRSYEGFPIRIESRTVNRPTGDIPAFNSWMEDCVIEQPYPGPGREVTFVVAGGVATGADPTIDPSIGAKLHLEPFGCGIRNCYMNFDFINPLPGNPIPFDGASLVYGGSPNVTVTAPYPHRLYPGDCVEFTGGGVSALNNKRFKVESIGSVGVEPKWAERIFKLNISPQPSQPSGAMTVFSSPLQTMLLTDLRQDSGSIVKATTAAPHKRLVGDVVCISGVTNDDKYNGTFTVTAVDTTSGLWFKYDLGTIPSKTPAVGDIWVDRRPNRFVRITAISLDTGTRIATLTTDGPHYRIPGDWFQILDVKTTSSPDAKKINNSFNNYLEVTGVTSRTVLQVRLPGVTTLLGWIWPPVPIRGSRRITRPRRSMEDWEAVSIQTGLRMRIAGRITIFIGIGSSLSERTIFTIHLTERCLLRARRLFIRLATLRALFPSLPERCREPRERKRLSNWTRPMRIRDISQEFWCEC